MKINKDKDIISNLKNKSRDEAFILLVSTYKQTLYFHIRRILISHEDTEDTLQETFLKVYRHLASFREESNLYTWLYRIATNEALRTLEKRKKKEKGNVENYYRLLLDKELSCDAEKINTLLQKAIAELPAKQKIVFSLRYFQELSYKEMEEITEMNENALRASYHLAQKKVKEFLMQQL